MTERPSEGKVIYTYSKRVNHIKYIYSTLKNALIHMTSFRYLWKGILI
jgi:hypothetical protein